MQSGLPIYWASSHPKVSLAVIHSIGILRNAPDKALLPQQGLFLTWNVSLLSNHMVYSYWKSLCLYIIERETYILNMTVIDPYVSNIRIWSMKNGVCFLFGDMATKCLPPNSKIAIFGNVACLIAYAALACCGKRHHQKALGEERDHLLTHPRSLSTIVREELSFAGSEAECWRSAAYCLALQTWGQLPVLWSPGPTDPRVAPPTVGWVLPY